METKKLAGLEPGSVFGYFEEICAIPHGSRNTKAVSDYVVDFAKSHGLRYVQDEMNNVIVYGPGTCGLENHPTVILQGHLDMVCEKDSDCPIDMATQGLDVTHDGQFVFAKGTTLGGDDGIAIAMGLALLADPTIPHPPVELVCTTEEEIGLLGADAMDMSVLQGRTMINLDSEAEGIFTVSCAGGCTATIELPVERRAVYGPCIRLSVDGLQGGHSGADIHRKRANANKVMGEFLSRIQKLMPLCLTSFTGGSKGTTVDPNKKAQDVTWEEYEAMTGEQRQAHFEKFASPEAYLKWMTDAKAAYEKSHPTIDVGKDGTIDIGEIIGKN